MTFIINKAIIFNNLKESVDMLPRVFISFDYDNNEPDKILFAGQAKNSHTPFDIADWSSKIALPESQWENIIRGKIDKCHFNDSSGR